VQLKISLLMLTAPTSWKNWEMGAGAAVFVLGYQLLFAHRFFGVDTGRPNSLVYCLLIIRRDGHRADCHHHSPRTGGASAPASLADAVLLPFGEFFQRLGLLKAS